MKEAKAGQEKAKRSAEQWVVIAREFGEKCVKIQQDPKLSIDDKLKKQRALGTEMAKEIQADAHLKESDKQEMVTSIHNYMDEWESLHDLIQNTGKNNQGNQNKDKAQPSSSKAAGTAVKKK